MAKVRAFISHISEDKQTAISLKTALTRDFPGLLDVFVSSDTESIAAGEDWLSSIEKALQESAFLVVLCSPESIRRPWINFEAGAAWMRKIPLIPICHAGLAPRDLPMPLSLRQGSSIDDPEGLLKLYKRVATVLTCDSPLVDFSRLGNELGGAFRTTNLTSPALVQLRSERETRQRLEQSLNDPKYKWRSIESVAAETAITEEEAANLLRSDERVRFSVGKSGKRIAGWRHRVEEGARLPTSTPESALEGTKPYSWDKRDVIVFDWPEKIELKINRHSAHGRQGLTVNVTNDSPKHVFGVQVAVTDAVSWDDRNGQFRETSFRESVAIISAKQLSAGETSPGQWFVVVSEKSPDLDLTDHKGGKLTWPRGNTPPSYIWRLTISLSLNSGNKSVTLQPKYLLLKWTTTSLTMVKFDPTTDFGIQGFDNASENSPSD